MSEPSLRRHHESISVHASAESLYDLVSDIARTGEWSPVCTSCWWDDGAEAGQVGITPAQAMQRLLLDPESPVVATTA